MSRYVSVFTVLAEWGSVLEVSLAICFPLRTGFCMCLTFWYLYIRFCCFHPNLYFINLLYAFFPRLSSSFLLVVIETEFLFFNRINRRSPRSPQSATSSNNTVHEPIRLKGRSARRRLFLLVELIIITVENHLSACRPDAHLCLPFAAQARSQQQLGKEKAYGAP